MFDRFNRKHALSILALLGGLAVLVWWRAAERGLMLSRIESEPVTIALSLYPGSALMITAVEQNYFAAEGLQVVVKEYPSGVRALTEGLVPGVADITSASDLPLTVAILDDRDVRLLAAISRVDNVNRVVARRSAGIGRPEDLRGKRIATQHGSAVHFFLYLFLLEHGLTQDDIELQFMRAEALPQALASGRIDAFSMREPYVSQARAVLGNDAVVFSAPGLYPQTDVLVARGELIRRRPEAVERVVRALVRAEAFATSHPQEVLASLARRLGSEAEELRAVIPVRDLRVVLTQRLITLMEIQARWAVAQRLITSTELPQWHEFIYPDALRAVKPEAVQLVD